MPSISEWRARYRGNREQNKWTDDRFVIPIALASLKWKYYAVYIVIDFFVAFVAWLQFPETRRHVDRGNITCLRLRNEGGSSSSPRGVTQPRGRCDGRSRRRNGQTGPIPCRSRPQMKCWVPLIYSGEQKSKQYRGAIGLWTVGFQGDDSMNMLSRCGRMLSPRTIPQGHLSGVPATEAEAPVRDSQGAEKRQLG